MPKSRPRPSGLGLGAPRGVTRAEADRMPGTGPREHAGAEWGRRWGGGTQKRGQGWEGVFRIVPLNTFVREGRGKSDRRQTGRSLGLPTGRTRPPAKRRRRAQAGLPALGRPWQACSGGLHTGADSKLHY